MYEVVVDNGSFWTPATENPPWENVLEFIFEGRLSVSRVDNTNSSGTFTITNHMKCCKIKVEVYLLKM